MCDSGWLGKNDEPIVDVGADCKVERYRRQLMVNGAKHQPTFAGSKVDKRDGIG